MNRLALSFWGIGSCNNPSGRSITTMAAREGSKWVAEPHKAGISLDYPDWRPIGLGNRNQFNTNRNVLLRIIRLASNPSSELIKREEIKKKLKEIIMEEL